MAICPYNAAHHVPKEDERAHLVECRDRRIVEMQKYNEPLPGHHGCLANPPFYGSALIPRQFPENPQEDANIREGHDDTQSSISGIYRHQDLRARLDPRAGRSPGLSRRRLSMDSASSILHQHQPLNFQDGPPIATRERRPLRRPILPDSSTPSRRVSPSTDGGRMTPSRDGRYPTLSRKTSPSPVRRMPHAVSLSYESGRLVPRQRSISPGSSSAYQSYK